MLKFITIDCNGNKIGKCFKDTRLFLRQWIKEDDSLPCFDDELVNAEIDGKKIDGEVFGCVLEYLNVDELLEPVDKRKVLFTYGMTNDAFIIITDAPKFKIECWCIDYLEELKNGENTFIDHVNEEYYARVLFDSEQNDLDDEDVIGWDEVYELTNFEEGEL